MRKILLFVIAIILTGQSSFCQIKVLSTGKLAIGGGTANNAARLNISDTNNSTFYSKCYLSFGWGDAVKSEVDRADCFTFSGWYNNNRTFMVFGNGDVWSATGIYSSDSTLKSHIEDVKDPLQILNKLRGVTYFR